ncbi:MAG: hypothetical protein WB783_18710 [Arenicellales bacterium]
MAELFINGTSFAMGAVNGAGNFSVAGNRSGATVNAVGNTGTGLVVFTINAGGPTVVSSRNLIQDTQGLCST